jgi:cytochrome c oxidase accessory protein FixG
MPSAPLKLPTLDERVLSTLNADGSRRWLRPTLSRGRFLTARRWTAYGLIALFVAIPFLRINGRPAILLDVANREFSLFGATFFPTDTVLLSLLLLGACVSVFLVTALYGRIWCGWACPQTVYLEFVFRPIERLFDGRPTRWGEPSRPPNGFRTALKCAAFLFIAFLLANLFLSYFVGVDALQRWMGSSPFEHPAPFLVMAATTALMMFDFGYFREQTCILACPYGRLQSVLFDRQTRIIAYDARRGEPRGKSQSGGAGDCVDCGMCVITCPTGIDIRNGLQLECIGCAQCIDACDRVMERIHRPAGLIRYGSQTEMSGQPRARRARIVAYYGILTLIVSAFVFVLVTKRSADVTLTRGLGMPFTELADGEISNSIVVKITNRTDTPVEYRLELIAPEHARLEIEENPIRIDPRHSRTARATLIAPRDTFIAGVADATIHVSAPPKFLQEMKYRMLGPMRGY